jgi:Spx/MgsR family transcriptional regulator
MPMRVYGLKSCDTCRKAVKALEAAGHEVDFVDIRATPLAEAELARFLELFGARLVNTRSTTWRALSDAERARAPLDLLAAHPAVMKRPVIEGEGRVHLGWDAGVRAEVT